MADALTPPQGLIAISDRRKIYGLPMGLGVGGAGTAVKVILPPSHKQSGGQRAILIGEYEPAVYPPTVERPYYQRDQVAGVRVRVAALAAVPVSGAGCRVRVVPDDEIVKVRFGSGNTPASVRVISI